MIYDLIFPALLAFAIVAAIGPIGIPMLKRLKIGQTEREELKSHLAKAGTPTMGGIMIILAVVVSSLCFVHRYPHILPVLLLTVGFGVIGFIDDYLKVVLRRSDGLLAWQKMICQIVVTSAFAAYVFLYSGISTKLLIPFSNYFVDGGYYWDIGFLAIPLMYFVVIGTSNGVNFTDGVDGLLSTVTLPVAAFFLITAMQLKVGVQPICSAMIGALLGFLLYNVHPAKVFMGDTGSLAIGGFVAGVAYMLQMPLFIVIVGLVYLVEVLSVMIQVTYFKKTGGKRVFRMAPIHHHFELGGWSETKVVGIFSIVTTILCLIALLGISMF